MHRSLMKGGGATTENKRVTRDKMTKPRKAAAAEKRKGAAAAEKRKGAAAAVRHETAARETSVTAQLVTSQLQKNCAGNSTRAADSNNVHLSLPSMSALALMSNFVTTRLPKKCRGDRPNLRQNNKQKGFSCGDESGAGDATDAQRAKCSTRERERGTMQRSGSLHDKQCVRVYLSFTFTSTLASSRARAVVQ